MLLSDEDILKEIEIGNLVLNPFDSLSVAPSSVKLHLGSPIYCIWPQVDLVDIKDASTYPVLKEVPIGDDGGVIMSRDLVYLCPTKEKIGLGPQISALIDGSSNLARLGVSIAFSGHVACGFGRTSPGILTLEIKSHAVSNIKLYIGMPICNLLIFRQPKRSQNLYGKNPWNHSGEQGVIGSLLYMKYTTINHDD